MCSTSPPIQMYNNSNNNSCVNNFKDKQMYSVPSESINGHRVELDGQNKNGKIPAATRVNRIQDPEKTKLIGNGCDVSEIKMAAPSFPGNHVSPRYTCNTNRAFSASPPRVTGHNNWSVPSIHLEPAADISFGDSSSSNLVTELTDELDRKLSDMLNGFHSQESPNEIPPSDHVTLPCRYARRTSDAHESMTSLCNHAANDEDEEDDILNREKDLGTALKWIRQEILQMKEQDKSLLKQFIELRASILQLRCLYDMNGSCSDVSSLDGSTYSLNEPTKSPRLRRIVLEGDCFLKPSYSLPNSPRVARFKWRSDEII